MCVTPDSLPERTSPALEGTAARQLPRGGGFSQSSLFFSSSVVVDISVLSVFFPAVNGWHCKLSDPLETYGSFTRTGVWDQQGVKRNLPFSQRAGYRTRILQFHGYKMTMASVKSILGEAGH